MAHPVDKNFFGSETRLIKFQYKNSENIDTTKNNFIMSCEIAKTNIDYDTK